MPKLNTTAKPARKLTGKATAKPTGKAVSTKASKPAAKPEASERMHGFNSSYTGASPVFRQHGRKLSPIVLDRAVNGYTERDAAFLASLYSHFKLTAFQRRDIDAGALSRLIGHGYVNHVSGAVDERTATFAVTPAAVKARLDNTKAKRA